MMRVFLLWATILSLCIAGCVEKEPAKKVSLEARDAEPKTIQRDNRGEVLHFGFDLRLGPREDVKVYMPFLKYLERATGRRFSIRFTESYEDTVDNLGKGITQFAALGPVNGVIAEERYKVGCLVMGLNEFGKPEYKSVIFTRVDSPIHSLEEIRGRTFAFGDRRSTQGHLIARKMLEDRGIRLSDFRSYIYSGSHANTARAVLNGLYDAGAIQDTFARRLERDGKIRVIAESDAYPSSLICVNKSINGPVINQVRDALLRLKPQAEHKGILPGWELTEMPAGFVEYDEKKFSEIRSLAHRYGLLR